MVSEQEYHKEFGILYGAYRYELDRLLGQFQEGTIGRQEFANKLERDAIPHLEDAKSLAKILLHGLYIDGKPVVNST
tara:strand:- start:13631 stop:13861 length:231 start_codon:yes stop_codon:yes gene_type:complete